MASGHDPADGRTTRDAESAQAEETEVEDEDSHPRPELRWVQIRRPKGVAEVGRNGRIIDSHYHPRYDAWEVLLETYEGELSE